MSEGPDVKWPRVREILEGIMKRWEAREGRRGLPGIHDYYWESPQHLANDSAMSMKFIEPGLPAEETAAERRDSPLSTADTSRSRRSLERGLVMRAGLLHQPTP